MKNGARLALLVMLLLSGQTQAGKVVRLYNAWPEKGYAFQIMGWWDGLGWNGTNTAGNAMTNDGNWYGFDLPATYKPAAPVNQSGVFFCQGDWSVSYDNAGLGKGQTFIDIASVLRTSDTVWIVPNTLPNGPPKLSGVRPRQTIIQFLSPWDTLVPSLQLETSAWRAMKPTTTPQWYSLFVLGFSSLQLKFRSSDSASYLGALGVGAAGVPFTVPDSLANLDTVWIYPGAGSLPKWSRAMPASKVLMVLNPWGGTVPVHHPRLTISGGKPRQMSPSSASCGWYGYSYYEQAKNAFLSDDRSAATAGAEGLGGTRPIDLSSIFAKSDTAWLSFDTANKTMRLEASWNGQVGLCELVKLAATFRDFKTYKHKEFGRGQGCGRGGWDVVKGMVDPILGLDRKPVRSQHDTGMKVNGSWAYRCTYDTATGGRASIGDSGISTEWFRDMPNLGTTYAKTCRDIPLALDSVGNYTHNSPYFFPLDDFAKQEDGTANPGFDQEPSGDGRMHNFGYCLESHGNFDYRAGQIFNFAGDDDVWFYINNRLVVDIGGIHGQATGSVKLDTIGVKVVGKDTTRSVYALVPGKTYTWDFFFCERNPSGSSMKISTSMNMRTQSGFQVRDTVEAPGTVNYTTFVSRVSGQGCQAVTQVTRTASRYELVGGSMDAPLPLTTGKYYGGVIIDTAKGWARIDSSAIYGLAPGIYALRILSKIDSSSFQDIPFKVPYTAGPKFVGAAPYTAIVGSRFPIAIGAFNKMGVDSGSVRFSLRDIPGIRYFKDSMLTIPVIGSDTLYTGLDGAVRRVWVEGVVAGTYSLVVGKIASDSADVWTNVVFQDRGLRFVDASGSPVSTRGSIVRNLRDTVVFRMEAFSIGLRCTACFDSISFGGASAGLRFLDSTGRSVDGIRLLSGYALVRVVAASGTVRGGKFVGVGERGDTLAWSPVSFLPPRLVFVDSSGKASTTRSASVADYGDTLSWKLELRDVDDLLCRTCDDSTAWRGADVGLHVLDVFGKPVSIVRFVGGSVELRLTSTAVVRSQKLSAISEFGDTVVWSPISFLPPRLVFVDAKGMEISAFPADSLTESVVGPLEVRARGVHGECSNCSGDVRFSSDVPGLVFLDDRQNPTSSVPLAGGVAKVWIRSDKAASSVMLIANHLVYDRDTLGGIAFHVEGPLLAGIFDADGDGRADSMAFSTRSSLQVGDTLSVGWPGPDGPVRKILLSSKVDAFKRWGTRLDPFEIGATTCMGMDCAGLGGWSTLDAFGNGLRQTFALTDSVAPVAVRSRLRFSADALIPDTLEVEASEALVAREAGSWISWGRSSLSIEGAPVPAIEAALLPDGRTVRLLVHAGTEFKLGKSDSLRLSANGAISDGVGNRPGQIARWVPVEVGPRPPSFDFGLIASIREVDNGAWQIPSGEPSMLALVRDPASGTWSTLDGKSVTDTNRLAGIWMQVNGPWGGQMIVYDNLGNFVASLDLTDAENAYIDGRLQDASKLDARGGVRLWLSWNGTSSNGSKVPTGIYLIRLVTVQPSTGGSQMVNRTYRIGWKRRN